MATTSAAVVMSPLPITGMSSASTTRAISSQFAAPENIWVRVRACSVRAWAPASRQRRATETGSRWVSSQPLRIFTVTGRCVAVRTARMICCTSPRSFKHPDPPLFLTTFLTGQPKLMSMKSGLTTSVTISAARAMIVASAPYSWMPMGRSASSKRMSSNKCSKPRATPTAEMNSDTTTSAPKRRHSSRKGDSDTPDMGARKSGNACPERYGKSMAHNVMTRCARSNHSLRFAAVHALETARALARVLFPRRDQPAAAKRHQGRRLEGTSRPAQSGRQGRADPREDAEAARDARLDGDRSQHRDSPLPRARREPAARRFRPQARGGRLQRDRRQAGELLLPDRGPTARSVQPIPAGARQDRAVCEGSGCTGKAREDRHPAGVPQAPRRQEHLERSVVGYGVLGYGVLGYSVACGQVRRYRQRLTRQRLTRQRLTRQRLTRQRLTRQRLNR